MEQEKVYDSAEDGQTKSEPLSYEPSVEINFKSDYTRPKEDDNEIQFASPPPLADPMESYPILTIDDDKWIQRIFQQYLTSWGFEHNGAPDAFMGLSEAIKVKPLLIFLDVVLPEVNGDVALKFFKKMEWTSKIPVIIISGNLNKEILKTTYANGAAGFISKPFNQETLFNKIKEILDPGIFNRMVKDGLIMPNQIKKKTTNG